MKMTELEDQIQKVRELRATHLRLYNLTRALEEELQRAYANEYEALGAANLALKSAEEELRRMTLEAYQLTGNKKPAPGVGIRIMKALDYEECQAIEWAVEACAYNCLKLDKKNFEKAAEALALDFVTINTVPQATISKEL